MQYLRSRFQQFKKKLTIIDYLFIVGFIVAIGGFIIFFRRESVLITIRLKVTDLSPFFIKDQPPDEYAYAFQKGDAEYNELGQITATILDVSAYKTVPEKQVTYVTVKAKTVYDPRKKQYSLKGKPISFGQTFLFTFARVKFEGMVVDFPSFQNTATPTATLVQAQIRTESREFSDTWGVPDFIANAVHEGDEVKDSKGNVLAKITSVTVVPARRTIITAAGSPIIIFDPQLKDVFLSLNLTTKIINDKIYMFDYMPVSVGSQIPLNLPTIAISPVITHIVQTNADATQ
ncbi:hypothetical protein A3A63_00905 [Candidatus Gottesmanbacteria bacterium RIFCSPLOWO2_01_FULL_46_9]|uniref:Uncharacterized protein n=1 Tax=Candidatus Gottesmanbacteria bacterium RIFCSPLOWO2_01_FULL_46_9 TaxID=1798394 RepID=A0A1F6AZU8_9BACT|nr:MAG: hypothetical protein A3A63_00905 [Candidatus Gottesmanbacteria bacterium RIFCSPLOWO2_01_FULL_46_9]